MRVVPLCAATLLPDKMLFRTLFVAALVLVAVTAEDFTTDADALVPSASYGMDLDVVPLKTRGVQAAFEDAPLELELTQDDAAIKNKAGLWRRRRRGRGFFKDVGHQAKRVRVPLVPSWSPPDAPSCPSS